MRTVYFKGSISVNFKKDIDLKSELKQILDAAEKFSLDCSNRVITIHDTDENRLNFIIRIASEKGYNVLSLRAVSGFLKKICDIFHVKYDSRKKYFALTNSISIFKDEYFDLYNEAYILNNEALEEIERQQDIEDINKIKLRGDKKTETKTNDFNQKNKKPLSEELRIPNRTFPALMRGKPSILKNPQDLIEFDSLESALSEIDTLIGLKDIKSQLKNIASFIMRNNERYLKFNINNPGLFYNTAVIGNKGSGKTTIAKILSHVFYHLGIVGKGRLINIDCKSIWPGHPLDNLIGDAQSGVIILNNADCVSFEKRGTTDIITTFIDWFSTYKENFVFIMVGENDGVNRLIADEKLNSMFNFIINIPDLTADETIDLVKNFILKEKFNIDLEAISKIRNYIDYLKERNKFENAHTAREIVEKAIIKSKACSDFLTKDDFVFNIVDIEAKVDIKEAIDPFEELNSMIGLKNVKDKVLEIAAYVKAQQIRRENGVKTGPICLHTCFLGNPGTGKTTVARLLGKIFNNIGVIKTDKFIEVTRHDIVGAYVGHTAMKVAEKVRQADGGVIFIDECYSLVSESKIDYGQEAVNTIVKLMEDRRENTLFFFAGYKNETEEFLLMNPGLKDRIQFKIEFDDFCEDELLEIWKKFCEDNQYTADEKAITEMKNITMNLYKNKDKNFSNARIIRKCFERSKMYQSIRILKEGYNDVGELIAIKPEDITALYHDKDLSEMFNNVTLRKSIGFNR